MEIAWGFCLRYEIDPLQSLKRKRRCPDWFLESVLLLTKSEIKANNVQAEDDKSEWTLFVDVYFLCS